MARLAGSRNCGMVGSARRKSRFLAVLGTTVCFVVQMTAAGVLAATIMLCFPRTCRADQQYRAADGNLSFTYPDGWKAEAEATAIRLTGPDGARYNITVGTQAEATGDPANSAALRTQAETLVKPLLSSPSYAGVRPVTVDAGSGAIYRFRGRGTKSDTDLAEVWFAQVGSHTVTLLPASAPEPDHFYEVSMLFKSIAFADAPSGGRRQAAGGGRQRNGDPKSEVRSPQGGVTPSPLHPLTPSSPKVALLEAYTGHVRANDVGFEVRLNKDNSATATWNPALGEASHWSGTYTGEDGNYLVKLQETSGSNPVGAKSLTLYMRGLGGEESAEYTTDVSSVKRPLSDIKLSEIGSNMRGVHALPGNQTGAGRNNRRNNGTRVRRFRRF